jgi:hydrogenase large subunit
VATVQLFTDYLTRLMKYVEFMKRVVPLHDDLFDFFYEALPGVRRSGPPPRFARLLGRLPGSRRLRLRLQDDERLGPGDVRHARSRRRRTARHERSRRHHVNIRILLGSSYYDDWQNQETFVAADPLGNPIDQNHPWNQSTIPRPQKRDFGGNYSWVMSPRWLDKRTETIWRSTPAADRSRGCGRPRSPVSSTSATSRRRATA